MQKSGYFLTGVPCNSAKPKQAGCLDNRSVGLAYGVVGLSLGQTRVDGPHTGEKGNKKSLYSICTCVHQLECMTEPCHRVVPPFPCFPSPLPKGPFSTSWPARMIGSIGMGILETTNPWVMSPYCYTTARGLFVVIITIFYFSVPWLLTGSSASVYRDSGTVSGVVLQGGKLGVDVMRGHCRICTLP